MYKTQVSGADMTSGSSPFKRDLMMETSQMDALQAAKRLQDILEFLKQPARYSQFKASCMTFEDKITRQMAKNKFHYTLSTAGVSELDVTFVSDQFLHRQTGEIDMNAFYAKLEVAQNLYQASSVVLQKFKDCL